MASLKKVKPVVEGEVKDETATAEEVIENADKLKNGEDVVDPKVPTDGETTEDEVVGDEVEDEVIDGGGITVDTSVTKDLNPTEKMARIRMKVSHRCYVGNKWWSFEANKEYNVPENLKATLNKNNLLLPL